MSKKSHLKPRWWIIFAFVVCLYPLVSALSVDIPLPINYSAVATVNASEIWITNEGILDNVADISTGDLTDDDTYVEVAGDTMTGDLELINTGDNTAITIHSGDTNANASLIFEEVNLDRWRLFLDGLDNNFYLWNDWSDIPTWMANLVTNDMTFNGNLLPWTTLTYDLGSGAQRWRWLYVQNISSDYGDFAYDVNIDGDLQVDGNMNVTNMTIKNMWVINTIATGNSTAQWFNGQFNWTSGDDWNIFDGSTLTFNESKLATTYYNATQSNAVRGTIDGGTLVDTQHPDGDYDGVTFNFSEEAGATGLDLRVNFTGVPDFNKGYIRYKTSSLSGESPAIQLWDYDDLEWEGGYGFLSETTEFLQYTNDVLDSSSHLQGGVIQMRLYKPANGNTNNHYYVDMLAVVDGYATPSGNVDLTPYAKLNDSGQNITADTITADTFSGDGDFNLMTAIIGAFSSGILVNNAEETEYILIQQGSITDTTGEISFDNENLITTGYINATIFNGEWNGSIDYWKVNDGSESRNFTTLGNITLDTLFGDWDGGNVDNKIDFGDMFIEDGKIRTEMGTSGIVIESLGGDLVLDGIVEVTSSSPWDIVGSLEVDDVKIDGNAIKGTGASMVVRGQPAGSPATNWGAGGGISINGLGSISMGAPIWVKVDNRPIFFGVGEDLIISSDGTNPNYTASGSGVHTFYNSSGLGTIRAGSYITGSNVPDTKTNNNFLSKLDNIDSWINVDNSINYESHYAGVKVPIKDENNCEQVIDKYCLDPDCWEYETEEPLKGIAYNITYREECGTKLVDGLDLELRTSSMEGMIYELNNKIKYLEENCVLK